jgi:hypothetical protein
MQATERAMSNPRLFFALGALLVALLPPLIYSRFALALSLYWKPQTQRKTLFIDFTLLLGCLVIMRVMALIHGKLYLKTPLHTVALIVAVINATCRLGWGDDRSGSLAKLWKRRKRLDIQDLAPKKGLAIFDFYPVWFADSCGVTWGSLIGWLPSSRHARL